MKLILLGLFLFSIGCGTGPESQGPKPDPDPRELPPIRGDESSFNADIAPILNAECGLSGCHAGANFLQEQGFKTSNAPKRIINGSMPPSYSPRFDLWTDEKRNAVLDWFDRNM